jgi:hypothetical protein
MDDEIHYVLPENIRLMASHAGPLALKLAQRLHARP